MNSPIKIWQQPNRENKKLLCLISLILTLYLAACSSTASLPEISTPEPLLIEPIGSPAQNDSGVSDDEIVIGVSAAFSGPSQGLGVELYRGAMAYISEINANGGVHGRQITLRAYNDGYNPDPAVNNTISLVQEDNVFLLFNYVGTPTVTRILPLLENYSDDSVYLLFPFTGAQPQREPPYDSYVFNLRASYRQETAGLVENFVTIGRERVAVFYQADAYGRSGWDGVKRALEEQGLEIVSEATYVRNSSFAEDFSTQVDTLKAADPEAIIIIGSYQAAAGFIRDARNSDWDVPIANVSFVGPENLLNTLLEEGRITGKDYSENLINSLVVPIYDDLSLPAVQEYRELMAKYNPQFPNEVVQSSYDPVEHSFVSFEGFLNAKLLVETLERMGSNPDRTLIYETVESIENFDVGIDSPISFSSEKHQGSDTIYYTTVEDDRYVSPINWEEWQK